MPSSPSVSPLRSALRGFVTYVTTVGISVAWPTLMLTKVLSVFAAGSGSRLAGELLHSHGPLLLGALASLALGDFVARRHPGEVAFVHGSILFCLVFALSLFLSWHWDLSFVHVYGLLWPPHVLFALAGVWLGQRERFRRIGLYASLLFWPLAGLAALILLATAVRMTWGHGHLPIPLLVFCLGIFLGAVVRTVMMGRRLRAPRSR